MGRENVVKDNAIRGLQSAIEISGALVHLRKEHAKAILDLLKEQGKKKFFVDSDGKITPLPDVVRCKECIHRGKVEKCVLAAIAAEKDFPLFMLDNRGEWYCADGKREAEEK